MLDRDRITSLDTVRGFALLGILLMNIQSFAMPSSAYINPFSFGDMQGANFAVWAVSHVLADQKFMSLFSMLFGVGVLVFTQAQEARGNSALALHYRRCFWLLIFGLLHAYLLWYGDILVAYALCGFILYWLRNLSVTKLLVVGVIMLSVASALNMMVGSFLPYMPANELAEMQKSWLPPAELTNKEIAAYTSGVLSALEFRIPQSAFMQTTVLLTSILWRAMGMMLLGMALFKTGFFQLAWAQKRYLLTAIVTLGIGSALTLYGLNANLANNYSLEYSMFIGSQFNYWGSVFSAIGYASVCMLLLQHLPDAAVFRRLALVGRMAFSNYILQTLLCTGLFYYLGYFGQFSRLEQLLVVMAVWLLQLCLSPWCLARFKQGPLEWLWRCLTYWRWLPNKIH